MIHLSIVKSTDCGIFKRTPTCFIWKQFALSARQPSKDSSTTGSEKREKCTLTELFTTNCYEYCRWTEIAFRYVVSREMFCNAGRFPATRAGVRCAYCAVQFEVRPRRSNRHQYDGLCHDAKKFPVTTIISHVPTSPFEPARVNIESLHKYSKWNFMFWTNLGQTLWCLIYQCLF